MTIILLTMNLKLNLNKKIKLQNIPSLNKKKLLKLNNPNNKESPA